MSCLRSAGAVTAALLLVAGCGADDPAPPEPTPQSGAVSVTPDADGVQAVTLVTQDNYRFVPAEFTVVPGPVRVTVDNPSDTVHSLRYGDAPGAPVEQIPVVRQQESASIEFTVSTPGEYQFICTFHIQFDQRGTMIVVPGDGR